MKRKELTQEVAREINQPPAAVQDRIDELAHEIVRRLRAGEPVDLEGLGLKEPRGKRVSVRRAGSK